VVDCALSHRVPNELKDLSNSYMVLAKSGAELRSPEATKIREEICRAWRDITPVTIRTCTVCRAKTAKRRGWEGTGGDIEVCSVRCAKQREISRQGWTGMVPDMGVKCEVCGEEAFRYIQKRTVCRKKECRDRV
jgi:hypothetical protein